MRAITLTLVGLLAAPLPSGFSQDQQTPGAKRPQPSPPVFYKAPQRNEGHAAETSRGTPVCGNPDTRSAPCPPRQDSPRSSGGHTGRDIGIGIGAGIFAGIVITSLAHSSEPRNKLSNSGPQFSGTVHMSFFKVSGLVRGGWPLVIDYESIVPTYAVLTITTQDSQVYSVIVPTELTARRQAIVLLPTSLGTELKVADFVIQSTVSASDQTPRYFRVYGFGCGPRAVGSVAIDQLTFKPQLVTAAQEQTQFSFHAHANFDHLAAEFMQVSLVDHCMEGRICDNKKIDKRLQEGQYWQDNWNAKKANQGQIQYRVRGWMTADNGGDWVSAFSPDLVMKQ